jgi:hypothetical protein
MKKLYFVGFMTIIFIIIINFELFYKNLFKWLNKIRLQKLAHNFALKLNLRYFIAVSGDNLIIIHK